MASSAVEILLRQEDGARRLKVVSDRIVPLLWSTRQFHKFMARDLGMPWNVRPPSPDMAQMLDDIQMPDWKRAYPPLTFRFGR